MKLALILILSIFAYIATFNFGRYAEQRKQNEARIGFFISIITWAIVIAAAMTGNQ